MLGLILDFLVHSEHDAKAFWQSVQCKLIKNRFEIVTVNLKMTLNNYSTNKTLYKIFWYAFGEHGL